MCIENHSPEVVSVFMGSDSLVTRTETLFAIKRESFESLKDFFSTIELVRVGIWAGRLALIPSFGRGRWGRDVGVGTVPYEIRSSCVRCGG